MQTPRATIPGGAFFCSIRIVLEKGRAPLWLARRLTVIARVYPCLTRLRHKGLRRSHFGLLPSIRSASLPLRSADWFREATACAPLGCDRVRFALADLHFVGLSAAVCARVHRVGAAHGSSVCSILLRRKCLRAARCSTTLRSAAHRRGFARLAPRSSSQKTLLVATSRRTRSLSRLACSAPFRSARWRAAHPRLVPFHKRRATASNHNRASARRRAARQRRGAPSHLAHQTTRTSAVRWPANQPTARRPRRAALKSGAHPRYVRVRTSRAHAFYSVL